MASLYIHIPFCHHKCIYCDFYSIAQKVDKDLYINNLLSELEYRKDFLTDKPQTIYFGGGTPSLLTIKQVDRILKGIDRVYGLENAKEITFETNPEDSKEVYLRDLKSLGINRLSIGIESFDDRDLRLLNRSHNSLTAKASIENALKVGFENISIDLISNLPFSSFETWKQNLETFAKFDLPHISSYTLMIEEGTMLSKLIKMGKYQPISEQDALLQLDYTISFLESKGYTHYETSSFAKPCFESKHNMAYWTFQPYLGIGVAAHSYKENIRMWNENDIRAYMNSKTDIYNSICKQEKLSLEEQFEEYVLLSARMQKGLSLKAVKDKFPTYYERFRENCEKMILEGYLNNDLSLTLKGWHLQDTLILNLCDIG